MTSKRIGVFEYCFGGGLGEEAQSCKDLLVEGREMAIGLAEDLQVHPAFEVTLAVDQRWAIDTNLSVQSIPVDPTKPLIPQWTSIGLNCDHNLVIAPEIDGIFLEIVDSFRSVGIPIVASSREFLLATSDKWATYRHWKAAGIPTPLTATLHELYASQELIEAFAKEGEESIGFVVKRTDGAGCYGLKRFSTLENLLSHTSNWEDRQRYVVQPWSKGQPASISLIENDRHRTLLPPCWQRIESSKNGDCSYAGGMLIDDHEMRRQLEMNVDRWIDALPGVYRGWIGVDFLIDHSNPKQFVPIEVNPRLTSSFIGLRNLFGPALAASIFTKFDEELAVQPKSRAEWILGVVDDP